MPIEEIVLLGGAENLDAPWLACRAMTDIRPRSTRTVPTEETHRERARRLIAALGAPAAAKRLGLGRDTIIRVAAGMPIHRGTLALLEKSLTTEAAR